LPQLIAAINATGYGLTLGIHSRIDETIDFIAAHARVGNIYVNRNIVGAVVGVQPFGGEGKSGTGPKAGGPLYLKRLQRNPAVAFGAPAIDAGKGIAANALDALLAWDKVDARGQLSALGKEYARTTLLFTSLPLPGPTGERNTLSFAARGTVLCAAASVRSLLNQLAAVLATGNIPAVATMSAPLIPTDLPPAVRELIRIADRIDGTGMPIHLALIDASLAPALRPVLAARDGALIAVIETTEQAAIPLWRLVAERALCVNTTAAGGNASLMTLKA
jgi:RHH-type proline utilization regulon transcriptional repressor/proline dehydrogenase/delta 1-pyrroline-5-carboxylate dehydrogenase